MAKKPAKKVEAASAKPVRKDRTSSYLLIVGLLLIGTGLYLGKGQLEEYWYKLHHHQATTFAAAVNGQGEENHPKKLIKGHPISMSIPSLGVSLDIVDGQYYPTAKTWTLTLDKAQYATMTPEPNNQGGNTFIYGHNRVGVLHTLYQIQPSARLIIKTDNKHTFTYAFMSSLETNPNDTSLFHYQGAPIVTLQTCSGLWYQNRQLFTFKLVKAV